LRGGEPRRVARCALISALMSVLSVHMLSAGDAEVIVTQVDSLPKNPSVQGSSRLPPPLSSHAASLAILTRTSLAMRTPPTNAHLTGRTPGSRTRYASLALLLPLTFVLLGPLRPAHRARYLPHPLMMIVLALLFLPTPPAPLPFRPLALAHLC
jgi:hypothetical protein